MNLNRNIVNYIVLTLIVFIGAFFWWEITVDDTFIILRYARNIANGYGAVFNIQERVEGYSSPAWVFLLALLHICNLPLIGTSKFLGVVCALIIVLLLYRVLLRITDSAIVSLVSALWFGILPGLHFYASSGMETIPYSLILALVISIPFLVQSHSRRSIVIPLSLIILATMRPEAFLLAILLVFYWLLHTKDRLFRIGLELSLLIFFSIEYIRYYYYGAWLPNTFYAKPSQFLHHLTSIPLDQAIKTVFTYGFYQDYLTRLLSVGGLIILGCAVIGWEVKKKESIGHVVIIIIYGFLFTSYVSVDWMPFNRFALPYIFPLYLLSGLGLNHLMKATPRRTIIITCIITLFIWSLTAIRHSVILRYSIISGEGANTAYNSKPYREIGEYLRINAQPSDRLLTYEIGAIGFYSGITIIDHEGLVLPEIAHIIYENGGYNYIRNGYNTMAMSEIVDICLEQKPDWFLVRSTMPAVLAKDSPIPGLIAQEPIQNALLEALGTSMVIDRVFVMRPRSPDKYILLRKVVH